MKKDISNIIMDQIQDGKIKEKKEYEGWRLGDSVAYWVAQDAANKLESKPLTITGFTPDKKVMKKSKWRKLRKKLAKKLSLEGEVALTVSYINGNPFIAISEVDDYTTVANELREYTGATGLVFTDVDQESYNVVERWWIEKGVIHKQDQYNVDGLWFPYKDSEIAFTYPPHIKRIPVHIFSNNESGTSDIGNTKMWDAIEELNYHSSETREEWDMVKTAFIKNNMYGARRTEAEYKKDKSEGRFLAVTSQDGMLNQGVAPLISGSQTSVMNAAIINFIEDKILKYTFATREASQDGTNSHNLEIAQANAFAIEYIQSKKEMREEDYAEFFEILSMFGEEVQEEEITVTLELSDLLTNMIKSTDVELQNSQNPMAQTNSEPVKKDGE